MQAVPIHRDEAQAFVERHHRHRGRPISAKLCLGAAVEGEIVGVARPRVDTAPSEQKVLWEAA